MTNDPKKWWIDYLNERNLILRNQEGHAKHVDVYEFLAEARSRFKEEVIKALEEMKHKGPGGHGECCVCQTCKFPYDECMCTYNQALQEAIEIIKKL